MIKLFKYIFIFLISIEIILRIVGFGNPLIYKNTKYNYYPLEKQNIRRLLGKRVVINDYGMRTKFNWENDKSNNKIIFFGDSILFGGSYIDNNELFSDLLCKKYFKNSMCGNYGVNGYKLTNLINRIEDIDLSYYDRLIIVVSNSFDFGKSEFEDFPFYEKYDYLFLRSTSEIINHMLFKYKILDRYHHSKLKIKDKKNYLVDQFSELQKLNSLLKKISNTKKVNIFILPTLENLNNSKKTNHFLNDLKIKRIRSENLYNIFKNSEYEKLYFNNAHLNEKGHDYLAKIIYDSIK